MLGEIMLELDLSVGIPDTFALLGYQRFFLYVSFLLVSLVVLQCAVRVVFLVVASSLAISVLFLQCLMALPIF